MRRLYKASDQNKLLVSGHYLFGSTGNDKLRINLWSGNIPVSRVDNYMAVAPEEEARIDYALRAVTDKPYSDLVRYGNQLRDAIQSIERHARIVADKEHDLSPLLFNGWRDHWTALQSHFGFGSVDEQAFRTAWHTAVAASVKLHKLETQLLG